MLTYTVGSPWELEAQHIDMLTEVAADPDLARHKLRSYDSLLGSEPAGRSRTALLRAIVTLRAWIVSPEGTGLGMLEELEGLEDRIRASKSFAPDAPCACGHKVEAP